ncbi:FkbM family methyltransferase [Falsiphaeobacter marinintestinus]|uniref:FkbM family methyltransferase n=1 Tax=Falsiphaeobacter marinintestinus TaxID=1492905 RepID=UPI0011B6DC95|nr:FkbM family methyltransferase [Phaeobacter marinintestinus]
MTQPILPFLFRPYVRHEFPGWGPLSHSLGILGVDNTDPQWRQAGTRQTRNKRTGMLMELDLSDDVERESYFLGRYYDIEIQMLLDVLLKPGDTCIDVGANIGNFAMYAVHCVGSTGHVIAFEPQPDCCRKIDRHIAINDLSNVDLHNLALGAMPGSLELHVLGGGSIMATLAIDPEVDTNIRETIEVPVARGDDVLPQHLSGDVLLKIDVEGFELFAMMGMSDTITRHKPAILLEVEDRYLKRAGTSVRDLFTWLQDRGYQAWDVATTHSTLTGHRLTLGPVPDLAAFHAIDGTPDLLWLHKDQTTFDPSGFSA